MIHVILGRKGSGKSRLLKALCLQARRLILIDTLAEHSAYVPLITLAELQGRLREDPPEFRFGVAPPPGLTLERAEWVMAVCAARRDVTLAIDEIDYWYPEAATRLPEALLAIVRYGRHYNQSLVVVTRRPASISRVITSQATLWVFPCNEPRDVTYIREFAGSLDPRKLKVLEKDRDRNILLTEVAQVDGSETRIRRFDLVLGALAD